MLRQVTYSYARQNFAKILKEAEESQEAILITRRDHEDMAVLPATELRSLEETAHLLRSPENARRLLSALQRALQKSPKPHSLESMKQELELE